MLIHAQDPSSFLNQPKRVAVDSKGNVYIVYLGGVAKITPDGKVLKVVESSFSDIVIDSKDQVYLSGGSTIWKMNPSNTSVEFFAGDKNYSGAADGAASFRKI